MISESIILFQHNPRVRRRVSEGERGPRPPRHDEKGNDRIENITDEQDSRPWTCRGIRIRSLLE